ncbi:MAG: hypothetical protein P8L18_06090 [Verrucomicrobiota bacterium]|nr:hypothetical protein [Verrucomicrobiota bacterium]
MNAGTCGLEDQPGPQSASMFQAHIWKRRFPLPRSSLPQQKAPTQVGAFEKMRGRHGIRADGAHGLPGK